MREIDLQREILVQISKIPDVVFWRNNVGFDEEHKVRYGLCPGSADLIGIVAGKFAGLEIKTTKGRIRPEQQHWIDLVQSKGGVAKVVRSVDEAVSTVLGWRDAFLRC